MNRILAWLEMFGLFALLYVGIPYAGLRIDRILGLPPLPIFVLGLGLILLSIGAATLEALELDGDARARVRAGRGGSELLEMDDLDGHSSQLVQQTVDVTLTDDRNDVPFRFGKPSDRPGHRDVPLVDQDALRRRQFPREFLDEAGLVPIEPLQLGFDPFLPREEAADGRREETAAFPEGHVRQTRCRTARESW